MGIEETRRAEYWWPLRLGDAFMSVLILRFYLHSTIFIMRNKKYFCGLKSLKNPNFNKIKLNVFL